MLLGASSLHQLWICTLIFTVAILIVSGITVGVQLKKLSEALQGGLGGVMGVYNKGNIEKVSLKALAYTITKTTMMILKC